MERLSKGWSHKVGKVHRYTQLRSRPLSIHALVLNYFLSLRFLHNLGIIKHPSDIFHSQLFVSPLYSYFFSSATVAVIP